MTLPPSIEVVQDRLDAVRFILPARELGKARVALGGPILGFGLFITTFMVFWMSGPLRSGLTGTGGARWFEIGFGLMGLPGLVVGLGLTLLGLLVFMNGSHAEIIVTADRLLSIEKAGPVRWSWKRPRAGIIRVVIQEGLGTVSTNGGPAKPFGATLGSLIIESSHAKPLLAAIGYSQELLRPLAGEIARRLGTETTANEFVPFRQRVEVVERGVTESVPDQAVPRPEGTDITVDTHAQGVAILVPPAGLWKGSQGLFAFSLIWNGFVVAILVVVLAGAINGTGHAGFVPYLFLLPFLAVGVGILMMAISMGRRQVMLAVAGDSLAYRVLGPFRTTERRIARAQVRGVTVGPSGMEVNNRTVYEVQVLVMGKPAKVGLLAQRTRDEQEWVAATLRRALGVGHG